MEWNNIITKKLLWIGNKTSDDFLNILKDIVKEEETLDLIQSKSEINDLKINMRRDFIIIFIDYDNINMDINEVVNLIRNYLSSLPLIIVISEDTSIFDETMIHNVSFMPRYIKKEIFQKQLINIITILKYNRNIKDISHFPGNFVIGQFIQEKIKNNKEFVIMYIDIDNFKSFTDYYGLFRANKLLKYLSKLLTDLIDEYGDIKDFLGHAGGDDFVIIFDGYKNAKTVGDKIVEEFDKIVPSFYNPEDVEKKYIEVLDRKGVLKKFPLISISIISISNEHKKYNSADEIYQEMMILKKQAKQYSGSILLEHK